MSKAKTIPVETTWRVRDTCLCLSAQKAARTLARRFDDAFRPIGLTSGQFSLLISLNRPAPPPLGAVASVLGMDRTTLTANLKPLVKRRLVEVAVDPGDKRGRLLKLTAAGQRVLQDAVPIWESTHRDVERTLKGEANRVRAGLNALA
jgi:DNA-binding MarR family transcriptional regulator